MEDQQNKIYSEPFVKDVVHDVAFNVEPSAIKINKERTMLYLYLYAYAFETANDTALIELRKTETGEYKLLDEFTLYPEVVHECPIDYVEIPVQVLPMSAFYTPTDEEYVRTQIAKKWDNYDFLEDIIEGLIAVINSLERTGTHDIPSLFNIKEMKKYIVARINEEKDYINLEPVLVILEDVIEEISREKATIEFFEGIQKIVDLRIKNLMKDPKSEKTPAVLTPLSDITLDNLKKHLKKYDKKDMDAFMNSLHGDSSQADLDKAQYIRDYLQSA